MKTGVVFEKNSNQNDNFMLFLGQEQCKFANLDHDRWFLIATGSSVTVWQWVTVSGQPKTSFWGQSEGERCNLMLFELRPNQPNPPFPQRKNETRVKRKKHFRQQGLENFELVAASAFAFAEGEWG